MKGLYYENRAPVIEGQPVKTFQELVVSLYSINPGVTVREVLDKWAEIQERRYVK